MQKRNAAVRAWLTMLCVVNFAAINAAAAADLSGIWWIKDRSQRIPAPQSQWPQPQWPQLQQNSSAAPPSPCSPSPAGSA